MIIVNQGRVVAEDTPANLTGQLQKGLRTILYVDGPAAEVQATLESLQGVTRVVPSERAGAARGLRLPGLELLLGKGSLAASAGETVEDWLFRHFAVERSGDWPVAAVTLIADGGMPGRDVWMRADPVSLRADGEPAWCWATARSCASRRRRPRH